jgi:type I restriction enzyme M protein
VLAILRPDGIGAVITPQGVLFRGGAEAEIRRGIVGDGRLEAVISLGPSVLQSTSIPSCILVLRGTDGLPYERRGQVMFIDAEREMVTGDTQNRLEPEAAEKIVDVFRDWPDIPGFSRAGGCGQRLVQQLRPGSSTSAVSKSVSKITSLVALLTIQG